MVDRRDGIGENKKRSIVHVEDGMVMSFAEEEPDVVCRCQTLSGSAATDGPADSAWQPLLACSCQTLSVSAATKGPADSTWKPLQDALWTSHEVSLMAKVPNVKLVKEFGPIAALPVIYKLYSRVMYMMAETTCGRLVPAQFALRKFHRAHEVVFIIRQVIENAVE